MKAAGIRKSTVTAFCCLLIAILAIVWAAAASAPDGVEPQEDYTHVGNSFARFSSTDVEVCDAAGNTLYSVPFEWEGRSLAASGEAAVAWEPGGEMLFLGEGGYKRLQTDGTILGVYGSECGAAAVISETESGFSVSVFGAAGESFSMKADEFWPLAAAVGPGGTTLAVLGADEDGYLAGLYGMDAGGLLWETRLDMPAYSLEWDGAHVIALRGFDGEVRIDASGGAAIAGGADGG